VNIFGIGLPMAVIMVVALLAPKKSCQRQVIWARQCVASGSFEEFRAGFKRETEQLEQANQKTTARLETKQMRQPTRKIMPLLPARQELV